AESKRDPDWFGSKLRIRVRPTDGPAQLEPSEDPGKSWKACLQLLVSGDFLSPVFLGMASNDVFGIPLRGDRAQLLEEALEVRYAKMTGQDPGLGLIFKRRDGDWKSLTTLAQPLSFVRRSVFNADPNAWLPVLLLNGTSVDDGRRFVTTDTDLMKPG